MFDELDFRIGSFAAGYTDLTVFPLVGGGLRVEAASVLRAPEFRCARTLSGGESARWLAQFAALHTERWRAAYRDPLAPDDEEWRLCCVQGEGGFERCGTGADPANWERILLPQQGCEGGAYPENWLAFLAVMEQLLPAEAADRWIPRQDGADRAGDFCA